ncbi:hypothetical protein ACOMHN_010995 [Nucella lapillus]
MDKKWPSGVEEVHIRPFEDGDGFEPLVVLEFSATANRASVEWLLAKLQAPKNDGGADLLVRTLYLQHNKTVMSGDENSDSGESDSDSTGSVVDENVTLNDSLRTPPAVVDDVDIAEDVTTEQFVEFLMTDWHDDFHATHRDEESGLHIDHMEYG